MYLKASETIRKKRLFHPLLKMAKWDNINWEADSAPPPKKENKKKIKKKRFFVEDVFLIDWGFDN